MMNRKPVYKLMKFLASVSIFCLFSISMSHSETIAAESCSQVFAKPGGQLLHERDSELHTTSFVEDVVKQHKRTTGISLTKPADKINRWLDYLTRLAAKADKSPQAEAAVKNALYGQFVMKNVDIPESYYALQVRMARELGYGDLILLEHHKLEMAETVIADQATSLDTWIDFMISKDTAVYPMWLKYWMFSGMTKLSKYDSKTGSFGNRTRKTVTPYPELNREALAYVAESVLKKFNKQSLEEIKDPEFINLLTGLNFGKLYGRTLFNLEVGKDGQFKSNEGRWITYPQGSDPMPLVKSLKGRNTGWCTAGEATARGQLKSGAFHIYYSLDAQGKPTIPRVAIRMEGDSVAEVRGVAHEQNLDPQISQTSIVSSKLKDFGDGGKSFEKKDYNMRLITGIDKKNKSGEALSSEELRVLYEIEGPVFGFGHIRDPRLKQIQASRNPKFDIARALNVREDQVSTNAKEAFAGNIVFHHGDLLIAGNAREAMAWGREQVPAGIHLPQVVSGKFGIQGLSLDLNIKLPERVVGDAVLSGDFESGPALVLPRYVGGNLVVSGLKTNEGLILPQFIGGRTKIHVEK
ncbi:MAG: hypothetical protein NDI61_02610 [Bdellovibrionaceae bacterium]|nr:hypothetical protein [Pseudobdellovibrionaceae bacterium]